MAKKTRIDCLFIHIPGEKSRKLYTSMVMPMGIFALADHIERNNYTAKIIHLGVEKMADRQFKLTHYLKNKDIMLIAISLHWAQQSSSCINVIKIIKTFYPKIKIALGGFTASYFAEEIMGRYKYVDFIIKGEGEGPLIILLKELSKPNPYLLAVPNLVWRRGRTIVKNIFSYVARERDMNNLNFTRFELMKNFRYYKNIGGRGIWNLPENVTYKVVDAPFPLCIGRGCLVNCSFCGGSIKSQKIINNRKTVVFRRPQKVIQSVKSAMAAGYRSFFICFDPHNDRKYYRKLFYLIRKSNLKIKMGFSCWRLPTKDFIKDFKRTFMQGSYFEISPESGSEQLRKLNKGYYYSNKRLINTLGYLKKDIIRANIYFAHPLPFSTIKDIKITDEFMATLIKRYGDIHDIIMHRLSFDPGSPMFISPDRYNIIARYKYFLDYVKKEKSPAFYLKNYRDMQSNRIVRKWINEEKALILLMPLIYNYLIRRKYKRAISEAQKAIKLAPRNYSFFILLGECYSKLGRIKSAIRAYRKADDLLKQQINF